jgi:hypothetical protein
MGIEVLENLPLDGKGLERSTTKGPDRRPMRPS